MLEWFSHRCYHYLNFIIRYKKLSTPIDAASREPNSYGYSHQLYSAMVELVVDFQSGECRDNGWLHICQSIQLLCLLFKETFSLVFGAHKGSATSSHLRAGSDLRLPYHWECPST